MSRHHEINGSKQTGFSQFKDGYFNTAMPQSYNSLLGFCEPKVARVTTKKDDPVNMPPRIRQIFEY